MILRWIIRQYRRVNTNFNEARDAFNNVVLEYISGYLIIACETVPDPR